jgi:hypothetical protein
MPLKSEDRRGTEDETAVVFDDSICDLNSTTLDATRNESGVAHGPMSTNCRHGISEYAWVCFWRLGLSVAGDGMLHIDGSSYTRSIAVLLVAALIGIPYAELSFRLMGWKLRTHHEGQLYIGRTNRLNWHPLVEVMKWWRCFRDYHIQEE